MIKSAGVLSPERYVMITNQYRRRGIKSNLSLTTRTMSPFTSWEAGMDERVVSRTTWHVGGIMARNDARMASDFCS